MRKDYLISAAMCAALLCCIANGAFAAEGPYGGTPAPVPGTVQAENYDTGGQGVAYNVSSTNGTGNSYRSDGVDLEVTTDTGGGYDLGWTASGGSATPSMWQRQAPIRLLSAWPQSAR